MRSLCVRTRRHMKHNETIRFEAFQFSIHNRRRLPWEHSTDQDNKQLRVIGLYAPRVTQCMQLRQRKFESVPQLRKTGKEEVLRMTRLGWERFQVKEPWIRRPVGVPVKQQKKKGNIERVPKPGFGSAKN